MRSSARTRVPTWPQLAVSLIATLSTIPTGAQLAHLVADIHETEFSTLWASGPEQFVRWEDRVFFVAADLGLPLLMATDGTSTGTEPILAGVDQILAIGDGGLFVGRDGDLLWTNGEPHGTTESTLLAESPFLPRSPRDSWLLDGRRLLSFGPGALRVSTSTSSVELDIDVTPRCCVREFSGGRLFFSATDDQFWVTDGTEGGSAPLGPQPTSRPAATTRGPYRIAWITQVGVGADAVYELYSSDGSVANTRRVTLPEGVRVRGSDLVPWGRDLVFVARSGDVDNLWALREGQVRRLTSFDYENALHDFVSTDSAPALSSADNLFFVAGDANGDRHIWRLERGSKTPNPLVFVTRTEPPVSPSILLHGQDGVLLFRLGTDLWFTDGNAARRVGECEFECGHFFPERGYLFNQADRFLPAPQLMRVDLEDGSTEVLGPTPWFDNQSRIDPLSESVFLGSLLIYRGEPYAVDLAYLDLETGERAPLGDYARTTGWIYPFPGPGPDLLFYVNRDHSLDDGTWRTQGDAASTRPLGFSVGSVDGCAYRIWDHVVSLCGPVTSRSVATGVAETLIDDSVGYPWAQLQNGRVLFDLDDTVWATDGTVAGTLPLTTDLSQKAAVDPAANVAILTESDESGILRVVETDGSAGGTRVLAQGPFPFDSRWGVTFTEGHVYFVRTPELIRLDRATGVLEPLTLDFGDDPEALRYLRTIPLRDRIVLLSRIGSIVERHSLLDHSTALRLDGTASVEAFDQVARRYPRFERMGEKTVAFTDQLILEFASSGDYLATWTRAESRVLWKDQAVYISAAGGGVGRELWKITNDQLGLQLVHDVFPGPLSSFPSDLRSTGERLYFVANDGRTGRELWSLDPEQSCDATEHSLCLRGQRFQADIHFRAGAESGRRAHSVDLTSDTGAFFFFDEANLELLVKILDGRGLNDAFWVFFGSLSDVEFALTVADAETGVSRRYLNPAGVFASLGDTDGLPASAPIDAPAIRILSTAEAGSLVSSERRSTEPCAASATTACLANGRFEIRVSWTDFTSGIGPGRTRPLTSDTGAFWFFEPANLELLVKIIDGRAVNGHFWVFYGALTNVAFQLEVRDTATGAVRIFDNPLGQFASGGFVDTFPAPPG